MKNTLAALALAALTACSTAPISVDDPYAVTPAKAETVKTQVTTRGELVKMFGEPEMTVPTDEGEALFFKDLALNSFWAVIGPDGKVSDFDWSK